MEEVSKSCELGRGAEDVTICRIYADYLESKGFKYAPEELANKFSVENKPWNGQLGFHSLRGTDISKWEGWQEYKESVWTGCSEFKEKYDSR